METGKKKPGRKQGNRSGRQQAKNTGSNNQAANQATGNPDNVPVTRKRGRPAGSKNKTVRKDHNINANSGNGDNAHMIKYAMAFSELPAIDVNNPVQVKQRVIDMFNINAAFDIKPSVASLAMAFHVDRVTLFNWLTGKTETVKNKESFNAIKNAYSQINLLYETYMNTGKINPIAAIFLMKNNMGYKDTTDYIITANQDNNIGLTDIVNRSGLLTDE